MRNYKEETQGKMLTLKVSIMENIINDELNLHLEELKRKKKAAELLRQEFDLVEQLNMVISSYSSASGYNSLQPLDIVNIKNKSISEQNKDRKSLLESVLTTVATDVHSRIQVKSNYLQKMPKLLDSLYERIDGYLSKNDDSFEKLSQDMAHMIDTAQVNTTKKDNIQFLNELLFGVGGENKQKIVKGFDKVKVLDALLGVKLLIESSKAAHESMEHNQKKLANEVLGVEAKLNKISDDMHEIEKKHHTISSFTNGMPDASHMSIEIAYHEAIKNSLDKCFKELKEIEKLRLPEPFKNDPVMDAYLVNAKKLILHTLQSPRNDAQIKNLDKLSTGIKEMKNSLAGNTEINAALKAADKLLSKKAFYTTKVKTKYNMILDAISQLPLEDRGKVLTGSPNPVSKALGAKRGFFSMKEAVVKDGKFPKPAKSLKHALELLGPSKPKAKSEPKERENLERSIVSFTRK